jgi:DNA repair exonuclease SbcCD ATPase subunit
LLQQHRVADLADAVAAEARRLEAEEESRRWREKLEDLLAGDTPATIDQSLQRMHRQFDPYLAERAATPPLPASAAQAITARERVERALAQELATLDSLQAERDRLRLQFNSAAADHRVASKEIQGLEANTRRIGDELEAARRRDSDESIQHSLAERAANLARLEAELAHVSQDLRPESVDTVKTLLGNAEDTRRRAEGELQRQQQTEAILSDRLQRARADGEFEKLQTARQRLEELEDQYQSASARAAAAQRLWQVLNKHRDATRQAYVRPLRAGIEQLGRIVFGADFSVELNETWTLVSCTRSGRTIPFEALSVGMKEQLGILTRLAAARIVAPQGGVPLIIDDALGFSDPGRLETMGAAIAASGRDTQIIVLTCSPERFTHVGSATLVRL